MAKPKVIGVLTGGGDCPGLNAVIRAVSKTAINVYKMKVVGYLDGFDGLIENRWIPLDYDTVSGILTQGGTVLGTSNKANPFNHPVKRGGKTVYKDMSDRAIQNLRKVGASVLVCIGGDGTMRIADELADKGMPVVGVPKTIDNDLPGTDVTFGFDSAVCTAAEAIDKLHSTAQSHHRVMVVETMGRYAGWLALYSGLAGGGDVILIPEIPYSLDAICKTVLKRSRSGRRFSIVVVAEGAKPAGGDLTVKQVIDDSPDPIRLGGVGNLLGQQIEERTGIETRVTVLGHLQRGGTPTPYDRILASRYGEGAARLAAEGMSGLMVNMRGNDIGSIPIKEVAGSCRNVPPNSPIVRTARALGLCFGDEVKTKNQILAGTF
ncbi:MAG: 6-phosphofructokinase [Candidatus Eisenbacteria sp.]|nr:6-phosphofructokinase [Candidatus Eisenbacteria bacterium]